MTAKKIALAEHFSLFEMPDLAPRYNIAPSQTVLAARVVPGEANREAVPLRWGLVPSWADDPRLGNRLLNARAETVADKPAFRAAFRKRRCLVLADGFYEWQQLSKQKQPYYFRLQIGGPFAMAGLWERWEHESTVLESCTLITTEANAVVRPIHDRMPVLLAPADYERWLDPANQTASGLASLLVPFPASALCALAVSPYVNSPRHDDPQCLAAAAEPVPQLWS